MSSQTCAHWNVIGYAAFRIDTTRSVTRIDTFVTDTALVTWAVVVQHAFRSTGAVRIADVIRWTDARHSLTLLTALSVRTARVGIAWSLFRLYNARFD
jgi:hypothetical protein